MMNLQVCVISIHFPTPALEVDEAIRAELMIRIESIASKKGEIVRTHSIPGRKSEIPLLVEWGAVSLTTASTVLAAMQAWQAIRPSYLLRLRGRKGDLVVKGNSPTERDRLKKWIADDLPEHLIIEIETIP